MSIQGLGEGLSQTVGRRKSESGLPSHGFRTRGRSSLPSHAQQPGILPCSQPLTEIIDLAEQSEFLIIEHLYSLGNFGWTASILPT